MGKLENLTKIVGKENVITDKGVLESFQSDLSFITGQVPECVVKPSSLEDIQKLVTIANEEAFALIPCSSGGPRFKGDTLPQKESTVIVDLSEMNAIKRIDKRNKVAMIEPGVTFGELIFQVEKQGLRVEMPMLPKKEKSVLASLLDREPTTSPKCNWDGIDPLCCMELVFGTGDMFRTGNAAGPGTLEEQWAAGQAQKVSMGPAQSDIARIIQGSQGTLGIATWTTIKLELMPALRRGFVVKGNTLDELLPFMYKMLWRKLPDVCLILNSVDLAAIYGHDRNDIPAWALVYSISGLEHLPEERLEFMEKDIADMAQAFNVAPTQYVADMSADKLIDIITGPSDEPYWKLRPMGGCQDLFFLTTLDRTPEFTKAIETVAQEHGFSKEATGIYIQPIRHGTGCHVEVNFFYDPQDPEESQKVRTLLDRVGKTCLDMGCFFSRPHGTWTDMAYSKCPDTVRALRKLKDIFDPKGVMNPDKLCFGKEV